MKQIVANTWFDDDGINNYGFFDEDMMDKEGSFLGGENPFIFIPPTKIKYFDNKF